MLEGYVNVYACYGTPMPLQTVYMQDKIPVDIEVQLRTIEGVDNLRHMKAAPIIIVECRRDMVDEVGRLERFVECSTNGAKVVDNYLRSVDTLKR